VPGKALLKKISRKVNPFAVANAQGLKQGTKKFENVVQGVTRSAVRSLKKIKRAPHNSAHKHKD